MGKFTRKEKEAVNELIEIHSIVAKLRRKLNKDTESKIELLAIQEKLQSLMHFIYSEAKLRKQLEGKQLRYSKTQKDLQEYWGDK